MFLHFINLLYLDFSERVLFHVKYRNCLLIFHLDFWVFGNDVTIIEACTHFRQRPLLDLWNLLACYQTVVLNRLYIVNSTIPFLMGEFTYRGQSTVLK